VVADRRRRQDQRQVVLAAQSLLDHLEVEQTQEATAEAETEGRGGVLLVGQGRVVELELVQGLGEILVLLIRHRVDRGEHHRLGLPIARQGLGGRLLDGGDGVTHGDVRHRLDTGDDVANSPCGQLAGRDVLELEEAHLLGLVLPACVHHADLLPRPDRALLHPTQQDCPTVGVVLGVEDHGLQRRTGIARGRGQPVHDGLEHILDPRAVLGRAQHRAFSVETEVSVDLLLDPLHVCGGEVDLVDHRHHLEVVLQGQVHVGDGLGLDPLRCIHQQQRSLTRHQGTTDLVREVDVAGRVDEVELVGVPVLRRVGESHRVALDGDPTLTLDVHGVEDLVPEIPLVDPTAVLDETVGEGRLAVIDVGNDAEGTYGVHASMVAASSPPVEAHPATTVSPPGPAAEPDPPVPHLRAPFPCPELSPPPPHRAGRPAERRTMDRRRAAPARLPAPRRGSARLRAPRPRRSPSDDRRPGPPLPQHRLRAPFRPWSRNPEDPRRRGAPLWHVLPVTVNAPPRGVAGTAVRPDAEPPDRDAPCEG